MIPRGLPHLFSERSPRKGILKIFAALLKTGVRNTREPSAHKYIYACNFIGVLGSLCLAANALILWAQELPRSPIVLALFMSFLHMLVVLFNKRGHTQFSRLYLLAIANLNLAAFGLLMGKESEMRLYFIITALLPLLLFSPDDKRQLLFGYAACLGGALLLEFPVYNTAWTLTLVPSYYQSLDKVGFYFLLVVVPALVFFFWRANHYSEEKFTRANLQLEGILEAMWEGLILTDVRGTVLLSNRRAQVILGHEDLTGQNLMGGGNLWEWVDANKQKIAPHQHVGLQAVSQNAPIRDRELGIVHPQYGIQWVKASAVPLRDEVSGRQIIVLTLSDLTERKKLEMEMVNSQKHKSLTQLSTVLAHEINTPLQYIDHNLKFIEFGIGELLARNPNHGDLQSFSQDFRESITESLAGLENIKTLVDSLKNLTTDALASGRAVDLNMLIQNSLTLCKDTWQKSVTVTTALDPVMPPVRMIGNPVDLNQIITQLITNAVEAIEGSPRSGKRGEILIKTHLKKSQVKITIVDNGPGIPFGEREKIFNPYFSGKNRGGKKQGMGMGLTLVKKIVTENFQGRIHVRSNQHTGTVFTLYLPVSGSSPVFSPGAASR